MTFTFYSCQRIVVFSPGEDEIPAIILVEALLSLITQIMPFYCHRSPVTKVNLHSIADNPYTTYQLPQEGYAARGSAGVETSTTRKCSLNP